MGFQIGFPLWFALFLIIIFEVQHHLRKAKKQEMKAKEAFWAKEQQSLSVRKKSFDPSDYIKPDLSLFHFDAYTPTTKGEERELKTLVSNLTRLSKLDMMNFNHMTNSEIRLTFGTSNQTIITQNEDSFNLFLKALAKYGHFMLDKGQVQEATISFKHLIDLGSDYHDHFITLATIYQENNKKEAIQELIEKASQINSINKESLLNKLKNYLS